CRLSLLLFSRYRSHLDLHSFPTRRSSDLNRRPEATALIAELGMSGELVHPSGARSTVRAGGALRGMPGRTVMGVPAEPEAVRERSEEHTSELQSLAYLVCRLLLEKKKENQ